MPSASRLSRASRDEKRDTASTRLPLPARSAARRTRRASEGPILPPAPRIRMSGSRRATVATSSSVGSASRSSSSALGTIRSGPGQASSTVLLSGAFRTGCRRPSRMTRPTEKPSTLADGIGVERGRDAVVGLAAEQVVGEVHEPAGAEPDGELRMVEGVVEQRRELDVSCRASGRCPCRTRS